MMDLVKLSVVLLALVGLTSTTKIVVKTNKPKEFAELEKAAINILTNCYAKRDKTIAVVGSFPGSFLDKLSSHRLMSLVLLDDRARPMKNIDYATGKHRNTKHKVHIVVIQASNYERSVQALLPLMDSRYHNTMAFVLMIGWSSEKKYAGCDGASETLNMIFHFNLNEILNVNLLCDHHKEGIVLYGSNPFTNQAPKPWIIAGAAERPNEPRFTYFVRKYHENKDMCKNLDYEKTQNLGGHTIKVTHPCSKPYCTPKTFKNRKKSRRVLINEKKFTTFIDVFIAYVNATAVVELSEIVARSSTVDRKMFQAQPYMLRIAHKRTFTYPHTTNCFYLVTRFRGNKSQLGKIVSVIDGYSWIGVAIVCFVTLMFFKYVLRQSLLIGILNVVRLSCNCGLPTVPSDRAPRIYMASILFFVVTMQGIFVSDLAALLTRDTPERQVDSVQDLADLGYTVYAPKSTFIVFKDILPESRVLSSDNVTNCLKYVLSDPSIACLKSDPGTKDIAPNYDLHLSKCVQMEYVTTCIPENWAFEEKLNKLLGILISSDIMLPLNYRVDEKRLREFESQEIEPEPRIITFADVAFAFVLLGVGLTCALVTFVIEIAYHRYHHRIRRTRVIFLN